MAVSNGAFTRTQFDNSQDRSFPRFFMHPVEDGMASAKEGRPIFKEIEKVEIIMPGIANLTKPVMSVTNEHRERWPREYEAFKKGQEIAPDGTPIEEWPVLKRPMVLELKALEIHTVEQIATLSDFALQRIGRQAFRLRQMAQAYLDDAVRMSAVTELAKAKEDLEMRVAEQDRKIAELSDLVSRLHTDNHAMRDAPNPLMTNIPGMADPIQAAQQARGALERGEEAVGSSLDALGTRPRRGRPPMPRDEKGNVIHG